MKLSVGRFYKTFGVGYSKKYASRNSQIVDGVCGDGLSTLLLGGDLDVDIEKIGGFLPVGKPFTITKINHQRNIINEIDGKPAGRIYRKYFAENFEMLKKTNLCQYYPLGIREQGGYRLLTILNILGDDSLLFVGNVHEGIEAYVMIATPMNLLSYTETFLRKRAKDYSSLQLAIVINSMVRKNILKNEAQKEVTIIKNHLPNANVIGLYCDYAIMPGEDASELVPESNNLSLILLK